MYSFISYLQLYPVIYITFATVLGLAIGSFINVVIYRLPRMFEQGWRQDCLELLDQSPAEPSESKPFNLIVPRSSCPHCGHRITALENIPIISFLVLRGKCADCHQPISWRYPIIELVSALLALTIALRFGVGMEAVGGYLLVWTLLALAVIDYDTQMLPDSVTLPLLWIGILFSLADTYTDLQSSAIGAIAGYLFLWLIYQGFKLLTGKEGMGYGDFKLFAALGAWLGWQQLPLIILSASIVGAVIGIGLILVAGRDRQLPIPFGPFLCAAGIISLLWGDKLTSKYLPFLSIAN